MVAILTMKVASAILLLITRSLACAMIQVVHLVLALIPITLNACALTLRRSWILMETAMAMLLPTPVLTASSTTTSTNACAPRLSIRNWLLTVRLVPRLLAPQVRFGRAVLAAGNAYARLVTSTLITGS